MRPNGTRWTTATLLALALVLLASQSPRLVPYCMDEFVHYHALGCAVHPLTARFHPADCERYDLRPPLLDTYLPLRSYDYIGSLPVVPFLPFWKAIGTPLAVRVQGAGYLLLVAALLARLTRVRFAAALGAALLVPAFASAHVVDLGPVGISLSLVLCTALLARRSVSESRPGHAALWGALTGLVVFLGMWTKPVFAWVLPALAALVWQRARAGGASQRRATLAALASAAAVAIPLVLLLMMAQDRNGASYLEVMREGNLSLEARNRFAMIRVTRYLFDGAAIVPRTLTLGAEPIDRVPPLLAASLLALAGWFCPPARRRVAGLLALSLLTLAVTVTTRSAWAPHHAAFWLLFLVGALAVAVDALWRARRAWLLVAVSVSAVHWGTLLARLPGANVQLDSNRPKDVLLETLWRESRQRATVEAHISWGSYLIAILFERPGQIVLTLPLREEPELAGELRRAARQTGRPIVVVGRCPAYGHVEQGLRRTLGPPGRLRAVGNWCAAEYAPAGPASPAAVPGRSPVGSRQ